MTGFEKQHIHPNLFKMESGAGGGFVDEKMSESIAHWFAVVNQFVSIFQSSCNQSAGLQYIKSLS